MKINKKFTIPLMTVMIVGAAAYSASQVFASTDLSNYPPMVQRLAERFGLKTDEVKTFFDEERQNRQDDMLSDYSDFLDEAVSSGELSEDKKSLLIAKKKEQQAEMENRQPGAGDREERRSEMQEKRDEMTKWAKDNGIDEKYLFAHGEGEGRGFGRGEGENGEGFGRRFDSN